MRFAIMTAAAAFAGCAGSIGDVEKGGEPGQTTPAVCVRDPGPSPVRRLDRFEYDNTVRDLLGDDSRPSRSFPDEEESFGFTNNAYTLGMSAVLAEQYMFAAEALAARASTRLTELLPCDPATIGEECVRRFVFGFGRRAFRRPLSDDERADMVALFHRGRAAYGTFSGGVKVVIEAMLQSPQFLYRVELPGKPGPDGFVTVGPWETASRLSYLLWGSMPDEVLFEAAQKRALSTPAEIEAQARRMVADPKAQVTVAHFHREWLELGKLGTLLKAKDVFPEWDASLAADLETETALFLDRAFWTGGTLDALLTAPYTFTNARLAKHYGIPVPEGSGFLEVPVDPEQRLGFLGQGAFLASHAKPNQGSPIHRGKFVREKLLCDLLPPPPPNVPIKPPEVVAGSTERERFDQHSADPACRGCHRLMDPIGHGFAHFDGIGRYQTNDQGKAVDANGELVDTLDANGPFLGVPGLAKALAGSKQVQQCVVRQWFRFGYGRSETPADRCTLATLEAKFVASGRDVRELLVQLALTDTFRLRRPVASPPAASTAPGATP